MKTKLIFFLFIAFSYTNCNDPNEGFVQNYQIQVVDIFSGQPIEDVKVQLNWNIGAGYPLHGEQSDEGFTDFDGKVSLSTTVDMDSVQVFLDEDAFLEERHIHQMIFIEKDDYVLRELEQDTAIYIWRPKLNEDQLVIAKVYDPISAELVMIDELPLRTRDVFLEYEISQFHPSFAFDFYGRTANFFFEDEPDTMRLPLFIADGVDYKVDYSLSSLDIMTHMLDTFYSSSIEFVGDASIQSQTVEITF